MPGCQGGARARAARGVGRREGAAGATRAASDVLPPSFNTLYSHRQTQDAKALARQKSAAADRAHARIGVAERRAEELTRQVARMAGGARPMQPQQQSAAAATAARGAGTRQRGFGPGGRVGGSGFGRSAAYAVAGSSGGGGLAEGLAAVTGAAATLLARVVDWAPLPRLPDALQQHQQQPGGAAASAALQSTGRILDGGGGVGDGGQGEWEDLLDSMLPAPLLFAGFEDPLSSTAPPPRPLRGMGRNASASYSQQQQHRAGGVVSRDAAAQQHRVRVLQGFRRAAATVARVVQLRAQRTVLGAQVGIWF